MNIEEAELYLNSFIDCYNKKPKEENRKFKMLQVDNLDIKAIETLLTVYGKEKEKNKELEIKNKELNVLRLTYLVEVFPNTTETHKKYMQELIKLLKELEE